MGLRRAIRAGTGLQRLYEMGLVSYPRTREETVSPAGAELARAVAAVEGLPPPTVEGRFPERGHEGLRPCLPVPPGTLENRLESRDLLETYEEVYRQFLRRVVAPSGGVLLFVVRNGAAHTVRAEVEDEETVRILRDLFRHVPEVTARVEGVGQEGRARAARFFEEAEARQAGSPATYTRILEELIEREYLEPEEFRLAWRGRTVLDWVHRYEPWLTLETSERLERVLEETAGGASPNVVLEQLRAEWDSPPPTLPRRFKKDPLLTL